MFWTAVASTAAAPASPRYSTAIASATPTYQQQHAKPPRVYASNWQISNAAFKARRCQQQAQHLQKIDEHQQFEQEQQEQEIQSEDNSRVQRSNSKAKNIHEKSGSKIFKVLASCKCIQSGLN
ncbi:uncharacterized protein Dmoj_GI22408 [Drosophila mojavensis]|uniref:Uncharacterized protein n=1 Tax=Drosophila mojavensis TaxID=7230 RepID=B4K4W7_DROMO|nr:uncharacterized protein Dmoj_GI22408 [Drosophila mojavensis]